MLKAALRLPLSIAELYTGAKSFKNNPVIGSPLLNMLGLHVVRILSARFSFALRRLTLRWGVPSAQRKQFIEDGIAVVPDFISGTDLAQIFKEIDSSNCEVRRLTEGSTHIFRVEMNELMSEQLPTLARVLERPAYRRLMAFAAGTRYLPPMMLERMAFGAGLETGEPDPQQTAHIDTFQPTMKSWLFLKDVTPDDGPFHFSKGSQKITLKRLMWEYRQSCSAHKRRDGHSEHGSFRVEGDDFAAMGISNPEPLLVKAGTLVVANTHAVHCRGNGKPGAERIEVFAPKRASAMFPIPSLFPRTLLAKQYRVRRARYLKRDQSMGDAHPLPLVSSDKIKPQG